MTAAPDLLTIEAAAAQLGVPANGLKEAARAHGLLVRIGRAVRIDRNDLGRLVKKCQDQPKAHGSTSTATANNGTSSTPDNRPGLRAASAALKLKKPLARISPTGAAQVLRLDQKT